MNNQRTYSQYANNKDKTIIYGKNNKKSVGQNNTINKILVNTAQVNNPIIKEFYFKYDQSTNILCDFLIASKYYCYFLSMRYHERYPHYIRGALNKITLPATEPKFLFLLFDCVFPKIYSPIDTIMSSFQYEINYNLMDQNSQSDNAFLRKAKDKDKQIYEEQIEKMLTEINMLCIELNTCLILCFSGKDIAEYIYSLSMITDSDFNDFSSKNIRIINKNEDIIEALCYIDQLNKNDAGELLQTSNSIRDICNANDSLSSLMPNMKKEKIKSIQDFFTFDFSQMNK